MTVVELSILLVAGIDSNGYIFNIKHLHILLKLFKF